MYKKLKNQKAREMKFNLMKKMHQSHLVKLKRQKILKNKYWIRLWKNKEVISQLIL